MTNHKVVILLVSILSSGCANNVYFGTSTRLAVDFSSETVGIGYKSSQFAVIPPKENGGEFAVLGVSDVDISISDLVIYEEFATGLAAECASNKTIQLSEQQKPKFEALLFGSYFSISIIDVNFGATNPFAGATVGYKRATATVVPIKNDQLRSVYAKTIVNSLDKSATETTGTKTNGIRFRQEFATGKAAVSRASANVSSLAKGDNITPCPLPNT